MVNCIECGRWLFPDCTTYKVDGEGIMTKDGCLCTCCVDTVIKREERKLALLKLGLIEEE